MILEEQYRAYITGLRELIGAAVVQQAQSEIMAGSTVWIDAAVSRFGATDLMSYWRSEIEKVVNLLVAQTAQEASERSQLVQQVFALDEDLAVAQKEYSQMRFLYDRHIDMLPESVAANIKANGSDEDLRQSYVAYDQAELSCAKALTAYGYMRDTSKGN